MNTHQEAAAPHRDREGHLPLTHRTEAADLHQATIHLPLADRLPQAEEAIRQRPLEATLPRRHDPLTVANRLLTAPTITRPIHL